MSRSTFGDPESLRDWAVAVATDIAFALGAFLIMLTFGFANTGVGPLGLRPTQLMQPVTRGIAAGLFLGKQSGIFTVVWLAVRLSGQTARVMPPGSKSMAFRSFAVSVSP